MSDEDKKQVILELKAITRRIEEDIRILVGTMDDIGQTEISVAFALETLAKAEEILLGLE